MDKHIFSNYPDFIKKKIIIIDTRFFYHFIKKIGVCPSSSYRMLQHYVLRTTGLLGHGDGRWLIRTICVSPCGMFLLPEYTYWCVSFFFGAVGVRSAKFSFIHCCPSERLRTGDLLQLLIIWFKHFTESGREWNAIMQVVSTWAKMATVSYKNNHFFITKNGANCLPTHRPVFN